MGSWWNLADTVGLSPTIERCESSNLSDPTKKLTATILNSFGCLNMKLFKVFNGYYGSASLSILVLAEDRAKALKLARSLLLTNDKNLFTDYNVELQSELIFENCTQAQCSTLMEFR
jgi:hypothetical protein